MLKVKKRLDWQSKRIIERKENLTEISMENLEECSGFRCAGKKQAKWWDYHGRVKSHLYMLKYYNVVWKQENDILTEMDSNFRRQVR